ncbi:CGLD27 family protein [Prochlorococcus sp. MIT 1223]|uniref:CGLD27 family protein n=1 Tax=Prochlorococcus sp. MIT 1223 TaxID=3096217 RepID=UPI002A755AFA|nr:CGLD27 family protein [Prochlorococcus sp. MIT 1223]
MKYSMCPVPKAQIPIEEYQKLSESLFFNWPLISTTYFYRKIIYSWLMALPLMLIISTGSVQLRPYIDKLIFSSLVWSLVIPIGIIIRHILGWSYIYKRLKSERVEYEESGWYDGQIWEKTIEMREKDLLTAQHDIKPILLILKQSLLVIFTIFFIGLALNLTISFHQI